MIFDEGDELNIPINAIYESRIIIVKEKGYYVAYGIQRHKIYNLPSGYEYRFEKTAMNWKYLFDYSKLTYRYGEQSTMNCSGEAYLTNGVTLEFGYKDKYYNTSRRTTEIEEEKISMTKISLNEDDIKEALMKNPPIPNKVGGTAFAIGDRYIVTALHVVKGYNHFKVRGIDGDFNTRYDCILNSLDSTNDMAVLYISDLNFQGINKIPYSLKTTDSKVGEKVFCLGYPLTNTMGEEIKLTDGLISSKSGYLGDTLQYQISAPVQPGNSGGPLFDYNGNLIGIIIAKHMDAENASYALKISNLKKLIKKRPALSTLSPSSLLSQKDLPTKVSLMQKYIYIIEAEK
ncbi:MAG: serine protease [Bacteroidetes bacterium]|nr:serine protease [Bacteroidota bacterium]